ncbi:MAG: cell wall hydrolase [Alphaproteobacteria bacterium]|nr:cell wall hydrolase [Alphaproteobacteria bacterium]
MMLAEAGGESDQGLAGAAWVIRNRTNFETEWPRTIEDVVTRRLSNGVYEYSPMADGAFARIRASSPDGSAAYERAERIAEQIYNGQLPDPTHGATFFEASSLPDSWMGSEVRRGNLERNIVIGGHDFFRFTESYYARRPWQIPRDNALVDLSYVDSSIRSPQYVLDLQRRMESLGVATDARADGVVDGDFGPASQAAVLQLKRRFGIEYNPRGRDRYDITEEFMDRLISETTSITPSALSTLRVSSSFSNALPSMTQGIDATESSRLAQLAANLVRSSVEQRLGRCPNGNILHYTQSAILFDDSFQATSIQSALERAGLATDRGGANDRSVDGNIGRLSEEAIERVGRAIGINDAVQRHGNGRASINEAVLAAINNEEFMRAFKTALETDSASAPSSPFGTPSLASILR